MLHRNDHVVISLLGVVSAILAAGIVILSNAWLPISAVEGMAALVVFIILENIAVYIVARLSIPILLRALRFAATGLFNTVFDTGIVVALVVFSGIYTGWPFAFFNLLSFGASTIVSYFINRTWSFSIDYAPTPREFAHFFVITASSMVLHMTLVYVLVSYVSPPAGIATIQWVAIAKVIGVFVSFVWNFMWLQFVVFRHTLVPSSADRDNT